MKKKEQFGIIRNNMKILHHNSKLLFYVEVPYGRNGRDERFCRSNKVSRRR